jgi:hypothetical protein
MSYSFCVMFLASCFLLPSCVAHCRANDRISRGNHSAELHLFIDAFCCERCIPVVFLKNTSHLCNLDYIVKS